MPRAEIFRRAGRARRHFVNFDEAEARAAVRATELGWVTTGLKAEQEDSVGAPSPRPTPAARSPRGRLGVTFGRITSGRGPVSFATSAGMEIKGQFDATSRALTDFVARIPDEVAVHGQKRLLIRASGPTLATVCGVRPAVAAPTLRVLQGPAVIAQNIRVDLVAADATAIATAAPGSYAIEVTDAAAGAGSVLVEVYELT